MSIPELTYKTITAPQTFYFPLRLFLLKQSSFNKSELQQHCELWQRVILHQMCAYLCFTQTAGLTVGKYPFTRGLPRSVRLWKDACKAKESVSIHFHYCTLETLEGSF